LSLAKKDFANPFFYHCIIWVKSIGISAFAGMTKELAKGKGNNSLCQEALVTQYGLIANAIRNG